MLYETLTAVSPFEDKNDLLTLRRLTAEPHRPVRELRPEVPKALSGLIDQLLAKSSAARPQQSADVVMQLVEIAQNLDSSAPPRRLSQRLRAAFGR